MISIADKQTRQDLIKRIQKLDAGSTPLWGTMSVYQMLRHCGMWHEMALGKQIYKQAFLGKLLGKTAMKSMLKDEPMKPNLPTVPSFIIKSDGDIATEKQILIALIEAHGQSSTHGSFIHPFFGKLTAAQGVFIASKHLDHHLRQFNV